MCAEPRAVALWARGDQRPAPESPDPALHYLRAATGAAARDAAVGGECQGAADESRRDGRRPGELRAARHEPHGLGLAGPQDERRQGRERAAEAPGGTGSEGAAAARHTRGPGQDGGGQLEPPEALPGHAPARGADGGARGRLEAPVEQDQPSHRCSSQGNHSPEAEVRPPRRGGARAAAGVRDHLQHRRGLGWEARQAEQRGRGRPGAPRGRAQGPGGYARRARQSHSLLKQSAHRPREDGGRAWPDLPEAGGPRVQA
mmetsp:Transcript_24683/g.71013  ORF Transcript_24683/g.71013 Transcript_24683/m.71013 type:complete len:259 (-) Transcript_24683:588-1364(-)